MKMSSRNRGIKVVVILGPTASGKSALAVRLAKKFKGEVISADSRQIYKGVDIGSDKITRKEMEGVPHRLLDVVSPKKTFTVTQYKKLAKRAIGEITNRGKIPIIAGGTGLYIDALINDWKLPEVKPDFKLREDLEKKSAEELFKQLKRLDPARAGNIDPYNKRRLVRALEIVIQTGKSAYSNVLENNRTSKYEVLKIGLKISNEKLKKRIKKRTLMRLRGGVIEEMENLKKSGVSQKKLNDISLYYRWVEPYIKREIGKLETLEIISTKIRQYAKRQMTWFKRDKNIYWISKSGEAERLVREFLK